MAIRMAPKRIRRGLKEVVVSYETFGFNTYCVAGPYEDLPGYLKWRHKRKYDLPDKNDADGLYFDSLPSKGGIIWLPRVPRTPRAIGTLTHEVGHAVFDLFGCRELPISKKHQEPFCYAILYGVETILTELRR